MMCIFISKIVEIVFKQWDPYKTPIVMIQGSLALPKYRDTQKIPQCTRVLQKVLLLGLDYFSATFYQTYFYYKPSKYSPFTETHFCNLFTQSRKADK